DVRRDDRLASDLRWAGLPVHLRIERPLHRARAGQRLVVSAEGNGSDPGHGCATGREVQLRSEGQHYPRGKLAQGLTQFRIETGAWPLTRTDTALKPLTGSA